MVLMNLVTDTVTYHHDDPNSSSSRAQAMNDDSKSKNKRSFTGKTLTLDPPEHYCWGTSYQANDPCEDCYCSLTNVLLCEESSGCCHPESHALLPSRSASVRMSLFAVLDGHGGPTVAEYASRHLLPLLAQDIARALSCQVLDSGLFQINGKTMTVSCLEKDRQHSKDEAKDNADQDNDDDNDDNGGDTYLSFLEGVIHRPSSTHGSSSDLDSDDSSVSDSSESSASSLDMTTTMMMSHESKWYSAPENDVTVAVTDSMSESSFETSPSFIPGMHSLQEQEIISATIQKSFLKLDEEWMNSIDPLASKQSFVVHNGKWNSGACCLVNIVLQRITCSDSDERSVATEQVVVDDDDDDDGSVGVGLSGMDRPPKAILYSCHTGDCRAVLFSSKEFEEDGNIPSSQSEEEQYYECSSSDSDYDEENACEFVNGATVSRKRMFLNPFLNCSPPTKRPKMWECTEYKNKSHASWIAPWTPPDMQSKGELVSSCSTSRSPSPEIHSKTAPAHKRKPYPNALRATTLTKDHTPYNQKEASLVRERCNYAPKAISSSANGGIQRVAGSLSVTRALGDAYLKTPMLSFSPYKAHAPYISALPEVSARILNQEDRLLVLASDGVWERVNGDQIAHWMGHYFKRQNHKNGQFGSPSSASRPPTPLSVEQKRNRRMRMLPTRRSLTAIEQEVLHSRILNMTHASDMIVSKVLNKVRKKHKLPNLESLMGLPKGHARRSKHDDITTLVVDLNGFTM